MLWCGWRGGCGCAILCVTTVRAVVGEPAGTSWVVVVLAVCFLRTVGVFCYR